MNHYHLCCLETGEVFNDDGFILGNPRSPKPAMLRAVYDHKRFTLHEEESGIYRYADWLPINRILRSNGRPVAYQSRKLAARLGLSHLYIAFSGYWPEKGALMTTGTFKECEAYAVCARLPKETNRILVVASAGNTARAFIKVASENEIPLVVVVPERNLGSIWQIEPICPCVQVIAAGGDSDYFDAINLADMISKNEGFQNEGGAKNVARRDGMGTTVLATALESGEIPDYYFQAVGSGTGAIAAYEANLRLNEDGRFKYRTMCLQLSQNIPFLPIYQAWLDRSRDIAVLSSDESRSLSQQIYACVLANRKPPYALTGGLYDALTATDGNVTAVTNREAATAQEIFKETEGCDICPEAGVALASLIHMNEIEAVDSNAQILLNITGGGVEYLQQEYNLLPVIPDFVIDPADFQPETIKIICDKIYRKLIG